MEPFRSLKIELLQVNQDFQALFSDIQSLPGMSDYSFRDWEKTCRGISKQIAEDIVRVAVVGPIKSGKSTFVNSLFRGDYLKRGAGVVTSIVTKIRTGKHLTAKLFFKFWDEINEEIEQALVLFPSLNWRSEGGRFEIRRIKAQL